MPKGKGYGPRPKGAPPPETYPSCQASQHFKSNLLATVPCVFISVRPTTPLKNKNLLQQSDRSRGRGPYPPTDQAVRRDIGQVSPIAWEPPNFSWPFSLQMSSLARPSQTKLVQHDKQLNSHWVVINPLWHGHKSWFSFLHASCNSGPFLPGSWWLTSGPLPLWPWPAISPVHRAEAAPPPLPSPLHSKHCELTNCFMTE